MKFRPLYTDFDLFRRSPCGERGLKCKCQMLINPVEGSLPVRGAWVEMLTGI